MKNPLSFSRRSLLAAVAMIAAGFEHAAIAQENYPTKPVTLIVPFTPGGSNDVIARVIAPRVRLVVASLKQKKLGGEDDERTTWPDTDKTSRTKH